MDYFPWNGSKRWLEPEIREVFSLLTPSGRYVEPFVGGGTVSRVARSVWPALDQVVGDANPWLTAYYERQVFGRRVEIPPNFTDVTYWRGLSDEDSTRLGVEDRALRFAICLLTAWGNRWEAYPDGRFRSTINRAYCDPEDLRKKLTSFFSRAWMRGTDKVTCADARAILAEVQAGDVVYLDPPYPETLGYGNNVWTIGDHLDLIDWAQARSDVMVVVSNPSTLRRLWERAGFEIRIAQGPAATKTRRRREEILCWRNADIVTPCRID